MTALEERDQLLAATDAAPAPGRDDRDAFLDELRSALDATLAANGTLRLTDVDQRGEGNSWETYLVTATWVSASGDTSETWAVKREPISGIVGDYDVAREVQLLDAAAGIGLRVPGVICHALPAPSSRGWFAMQKVAGRIPMPPTISAMVPNPDARLRLGRDIAGEMARLHAADPRGLHVPALGTVPDGKEVGRAENDRWRAVYDETARIRIPILDLAFAWLEARADHVSTRVALVHNDFRVGNLVIGDDAITGVLDWETAHFSDPVADIAWFAQRTSRGRSPLWCKLIAEDQFLDAYEAVAGWRPSPQALTWWNVQSLTKTAAGCLQAIDIYARGERDEVRYSNMAHSLYFSLSWLNHMLINREWGL